MTLLNDTFATLDYAQKCDYADPLKHFRKEFYIPEHHGEPTVYFCGNSLGLQPKSTKRYILDELENWKKYGVEGHFKGDLPWMPYHKPLSPLLAEIVGANVHEVVAMNALTVNLHLMMVSFYRPTAKRFKILMEGGAFPSDQYAVASQVAYHGFSPEEAIIALQPRQGEETLRPEDILHTIEANRDSLALVMMGGVNYYTGQLFPLASIVETAHAIGAFIGFDLAHAVGNVPLHLHDWEVDFATWCSYKYLNSSPGGVSGVFVHEKHGLNLDTPRFAGWWGHNQEERFLMKEDFKPMLGAEGWQLSNAPILLMAAHRASLEVFQKATMPALVEKSQKLTAYLYELMRKLQNEQNQVGLRIITPENPHERGCQLSLILQPYGKAIFEYLTARGVIADWREPDVIRVAPVPLYNSFTDVFRFYTILKDAIGSL